MNSCGKNIIENQFNKSKRKLKLVDGTFTTKDGSIIAYSDNKLLNKPTIFFIHGYLSSRAGFFPIAKKINDGNYRLIHVDVPGFGVSSRDPKASYKITEQAKRMNELIVHLELTNVHLVGTSMGGAIAIAVNGTNELIKSNTLIAPLGMPVYNKELPGLFEYFIETGKLAFVVDEKYDQKKTNMLLKNITNIAPILIPRFVKKYFKEKLVEGREASNKVGADILYDNESFKNIIENNKRFLMINDSLKSNKINYSNERIVELLNKVNKEHKIKSIDPIGNNYEDLTNYLQKIKNPVLVYWGDKDNIIHYKTIENMKPHLKNAKFTIFRKGSHFISYTKSKVISRDLKQLINQN